jgi:hypothetical protein
MKIRNGVAVLVWQPQRWVQNSDHHWQLQHGQWNADSHHANAGDTRIPAIPAGITGDNARFFIFTPQEVLR